MNEFPRLWFMFDNHLFREILAESLTSGVAEVKVCREKPNGNHGSLFVRLTNYVSGASLHFGGEEWERIESRVRKFVEEFIELRSKIAAQNEFVRHEPQPEGLHRCPICKESAGLWRHRPKFNSPLSWVVCCEGGGENIGPMPNGSHEPCPLDLPPKHFYSDRIVTAVSYWNRYAEILESKQRQIMEKEQTGD